jgi:hypothetical protein
MTELPIGLRVSPGLITGVVMKYNYSRLRSVAVAVSLLTCGSSVALASYSYFCANGQNVPMDVPCFVRAGPSDIHTLTPNMTARTTTITPTSPWVPTGQVEQMSNCDPANPKTQPGTLNVPDIPGPVVAFPIGGPDGTTLSIQLPGQPGGSIPCGPPPLCKVGQYFTETRNVTISICIPVSDTVTVPIVSTPLDPSCPPGPPQELSPTFACPQITSCTSYNTKETRVADPVITPCPKSCDCP